MKPTSPHYPIHHIIDNNPYIKQIAAVNKMADQLRGWNLKYHIFPDLDIWINTFWTAPFGKEEALNFLYKTASKRSDDYFGIQRNQSYRRDRDEVYNAELLWRGVIKDLESKSKQVLPAKWKLDTTPLDSMLHDSEGYYEIDSRGVKHYLDTSPHLPLDNFDLAIYNDSKPKKNPSSKLKNLTPKYKLVDAEKEFKNSHPPLIPTLQIRKSLKPKNFAKVIFQGKPRERMWIRITKLIPGGYEGILDNSPAHLKTVKYKDIIKIKYNNIIAVMK